MTGWRRLRSALALILLLSIGTPVTVLAVQSSSSSYGVDETFFGSGGELNACSTNYCSKQTAGETAVGNSTSANYQIQAGNNTARDTFIQFDVNATNTNLGVLTSGTTATTTATFSVKTYLASGYTVKTVSPGPTNVSHVLNPLATPQNSAAGTEQFGINVVANTSPSSLSGTSADPSQAPDSTFGFGIAAHNSSTDYYDTPNKYMYKDGDVIASSDRSSGTTNFTISYIFNINDLTPGGTYTLRQTLVATSTY